ncbi:MAG: carbohydrate binding domain-containing protein [Candidatus Omnitrophota bacterium]
MRKCIVYMLIAFVITASIITGCGQKGSTEKAPTQTTEQNFQPVNVEKTQTTQPEGAKIIVADFDSGEKPNKIGGNFGGWDKDPTDFSQGCIESFDSVNRRGVKGFAMKIDYDVDSQNPAYNGFWMFLQNLDASGYDNLTFWVKGDGKEGYTTVFKVELKNDKRQVGRYYVTNVTDKWQKVIIPLTDFKGINDFSNLTEFVIVFEDRIASNKDGVIYIDDIEFSKN